MSRWSLALLLPLFALSAVRCKTDGAAESSTSAAVDATGPAKQLAGEPAALLLKALVTKAPLVGDTQDFVHLDSLACTDGGGGARCEARLATAGHELLKQTAQGSVIVLTGDEAAKVVATLKQQGVALKTRDVVCLSDGLKQGCSIVEIPAASAGTITIVSTQTGTSTATASATSTTTTTPLATKGRCYCGLYTGFCMIFRFGDANSLSAYQSASCSISDCQSHFVSLMINECGRIWSVWPVPAAGGQ